MMRIQQLTMLQVAPVPAACSTPTRPAASAASKMVACLACDTAPEPPSNRSSPPSSRQHDLVLVDDWRVGEKDIIRNRMEELQDSMEESQTFIKESENVWSF